MIMMMLILEVRKTWIRVAGAEKQKAKKHYDHEVDDLMK